jgi:hypothetical protein
MKINRKAIVRWKIYFDRARNYVSYIQFIAMAYIVIKLLRDSPAKTMIFNYWYLSFPLIFIAFIVACLILGRIESLFKIREFEQENYSVTNPEWKKLMDKLDELLKKSG